MISLIPCPRCGHHHTPDMATAVGRFDPRGPHGWRSLNPYGPRRNTRREAVRDTCTWWASRKVCE